MRATFPCSHLSEWHTWLQLKEGSALVLPACLRSNDYAQHASEWLWQMLGRAVT